MQRLCGFIGHLPTEVARRHVHAMVSACWRPPRKAWSYYSAPEMGVYVACLSDLETPSVRRRSDQVDGEAVMLLAGDCLDVPADLATSSSRGTLNAWMTAVSAGDNTQLGSLNGFFSGILIDRPRRRARLFADRFGIERVFWCKTADGLYFASEAKALLWGTNNSQDFDPEGLAEYLAFGCTLPPRTLFRGIGTLAGAESWNWDGHVWSRDRYFDFSEWESQPPLSREEFEAAYAAALAEVVPKCFKADERVGVALTGGLDTRMVFACRPVWWRNPVSYTYAADADTRDVTLAQRLAASCSIEHEVLRLDGQFLRDFASNVDRAVWDTDGALGATGAHESILSERARSLAPVRVTGVFGGEVLRGISPWHGLNLQRGLLDSHLQRSVDDRARDQQPSHPVTAAVCGTTPAALWGSLAACRSWLTFRTPFLDLRLARLAYQRPAPDSDESTSVRMLRSRLPSLVPLPTDRGRQIRRRPLAQFFSRVAGQCSFKCDYLANDGLRWPFTHLDPLIDRLHYPVPLLGKHKYLRYRRWFRRELSEHVRDGVAAASAMPMWNRGSLDGLAEAHISGASSVTEELNVVLTLESVQRLLLQASHRRQFTHLPPPVPLHHLSAALTPRD